MCMHNKTSNNGYFRTKNKHVLCLFLLIQGLHVSNTISKVGPFHMQKNVLFFLISALNVYFGYSLEPHQVPIIYVLEQK